MNINLAGLNRLNGFRLDGINPVDGSGTSVASAGDVNGDGIDDLIIGAFGNDAGGQSNAGASYVVFCRVGGFAANLRLGTPDGNNGFKITGIDPGDGSGQSVASAGDVNGDGFDDLIIGSRYATPGPAFQPTTQFQAGESYVVFGRAGGFAANLSLRTLDGANGFRIEGIDPYDFSGRSVASAGDVNGDGFDDLIIGASFAEQVTSLTTNETGESYVVFGRAGGFAASLKLGTLDASTGFALIGIDRDDRSGFSVASAGDVNGDGVDDLIIGAPGASNRFGGTGETYVVFGAD